MNLYQCKEKAKNGELEEFIALFPKGATRCKWLDPYFGLFRIEGLEGFLSVNKVDETLPDLVCLEIGGKNDL